MLIRIAIATSAALLLSVGTALARTEVDLNGYDIVIGDTGDRYSGWDNDEMRTYVRARDDRGISHDGYFDSIASAFFVLKERYGTVRVMDIGVPDFGQKYNSRSHYDDNGLIDGERAWYFWDDDRTARGGVPLIYSFYDRRDAEDMAYDRHGEVMDFEEVVYNLKLWDDRNRTRVYWRGSEPNRWDNRHWTSAWNNRWHGYDWDRNNGWALRLNVDRDGDIRSGGVSYRNNGVGVTVHSQGNDNHNRSRNRGNGNRGRDQRDSRQRNDDTRQRNDNHNNDNNNSDGGKDSSGKYSREKKRQKNR